MALATLQSELNLELVTAYLALEEAKEAQAAKDSPTNRAAVRDCYDVIDALLDLVNEVR